MALLDIQGVEGMKSIKQLYRSTTTGNLGTSPITGVVTDATLSGRVLAQTSVTFQPNTVMVPKMWPWRECPE